MLTAPPARRGVQRVEPRTPGRRPHAGPVAARRCSRRSAPFLLFLGLVFGGVVLVARRDRPGPDPALLAGRGRCASTTTTSTPTADGAAGASSHDGPPPGVHMPGPVVPADPRRPRDGAPVPRPGLRRLAPGRRGHRPGRRLLGWLTDARKEYAKAVEADRTGHLESLPPPRTPSRAVRDPRRAARRRGRPAVGHPGAGEANGGTPGASAPAAPRDAASGGPRRRPRASRAPASRPPAADVTVTAKGIASLETLVDRAGRQAVHDRVQQPGRRARPTTSRSRTRPARGLQGRDLQRVETRVYEVRPCPPASTRSSATVHPEHDRDRHAPVAGQRVHAAPADPARPAARRRADDRRRRR